VDPDRVIIVIYGKGGVGKSTVSSHLSVCFAGMGRRVLLVGCDPKADTSTRLMGDTRPPTVIGVLERSHHVRVADVLVRSSAGVDVIETGGAEPGTGCGGRGVAITGQMLEQEPRTLERYDVVVFDVLGDLVCGGFVAPLRLGLASSVFIVSSEETASLYAANNIARVVTQPYYDHVSMGGFVFNLRDDDAPVEALHDFASLLHVDVLAVLRRDPVILEAEAEGLTAIQHAPESAISGQFRDLAQAFLARTRDPRRVDVTPLGADAFWAFVRGHRRPSRAGRP